MAIVVRAEMGPRLPHVFGITWRHGTFLHWAIEPSELHQHIPYPLELATRDGHAWVGVLPFVATDVGLRGTPSATRLTFPECNLRTYVTCGGERAVYFFSIDVGSRLIAKLAGGIGGVPCRFAAMNVIESAGRVRYTIQRTRSTPTRRFRHDESPAYPDGSHATLDMTYQPAGSVFRAPPGSLARWLTSPRKFFIARNGQLVSGEVDHEPWPLQPASVRIREQTLTDAVGFSPSTDDPQDEPHALYCGELAMTATIDGIR